MKWKVGAIIGLSSMFIGCGSTPKTVAIPNTVSSPAIVQAETEKSLKRVVAIARFSNETRLGNSFLVDEHSDRVGKQATDILSARLVASDKFIMLERADFNKLSTESNLTGTSLQAIPADYLIVGSVSEFGRKTESDVGVFTRSKRQIATATVNIRLVDTKTGEIIYSGEGSGDSTSEANTTLGVGGRAGYDTSLDDKALSAAISSMVNEVINNLLDKPWRAYILSQQDGNFILSGGESQGIKAGSKFTAYKKGTMVKNPQTNMMIEMPGQKVGTFEVIMTSGKGNNEVSIASYSGETLQTDNLSNYYVQEEEK